MNTIIICLTVIICVVWITCWITYMVKRNLPMFTYGNCTWVSSDADDERPTTNPVGFTDNTENEKQPTDKEAKEAVLKDPVTLFSSLLRGEVDIDDINI